MAGYLSLSSSCFSLLAHFLLSMKISSSVSHFPENMHYAPSISIFFCLQNATKSSKMLGQAPFVCVRKPPNSNDRSGVH